MMVHLRDADRQRVFEPKANIADAVPDQDDIDGGIRDPGRNRVVRGGHNETSPLVLPPLQRRNRDALNRRLRNVAHSYIPIRQRPQFDLRCEVPRL